MKHPLLLALLSMATFVSCKKTGNTDPPESVLPPDAIAPEGFTFATAKNLSLNLTLKTNDNQPLAGVLVNVYSKAETKALLYSAFSDVHGKIEASLNIPAHLDSLVIDPSYVGLMRQATAVIRNNAVQATIGGSQGYEGDIVAPAGSPTGRAGGINSNRQAGVLGTTVFTYHGSYDNAGRPLVMETPDIISPELLSYVNTSLPEAKAVPLYHPEYLANTAKTNLDIVKTADVWITFVHEGAGYLNTLGYYTYPTGQAPQTIGAIDSIKLVMPNASLAGSGGSMRTGDRIHLGRFKPGVTVAFVLLQNAWNTGSRTVNVNATKYFADDALNNEKATFKRHTVMLHDNKHKLFLTGFEDLQRDNNASDNDFNDLVFYATSNPVEAISNQNVKPIDTPLDTDKDGITDVYDKFPNDPAKALLQYFPSEEGWGTLAFEDLWPSTGDYDMNDLVVDYQYTHVANGQNKTVEMLANYTIRSVGATMKNGFGVQLPVAPDKIKSISGQRHTGGFLSLSPNGTESGQSKAVFVPFDDPQSLINTSGGFVNVFNGRNYVKSDTAKLKITFHTPMTKTELGSIPYNPFLIAGQRRGYEVHLPGQKPTDKADTKLLGTRMDHSSALKNKYYLTSTNWPWALSFLEPFDYPTEMSKITSAYSNFQKWSQSGGATYTDWYLNRTGYRSPSQIFKR